MGSPRIQGAGLERENRRDTNNNCLQFARATGGAVLPTALTESSAHLALGLRQLLLPRARGIYASTAEKKGHVHTYVF